MEMAALEARRVAQATEAALEDSDDEGEPLRSAAAAAQQQVSLLRFLARNLTFSRNPILVSMYTGAMSTHIHSNCWRVA